MQWHYIVLPLLSKIKIVFVFCYWSKQQNNKKIVLLSLKKLQIVIVLLKKILHIFVFVLFYIVFFIEKFGQSVTNCS